MRVAVALVVGQALLGTLIGWLTLSQSRLAENSAGTSAVDQLAAPPVAPGPPVLGTASAATPASSVPSRAPSQRQRRTAAAEPPAPSLPPTGPTPSLSPGLIMLPPPVPPAASSAVPPAPPAASPPATPSATSSASPSPSGRVREPVTVGDRCWPQGAFGRTADGTLVRCEAERHRRPRWKIV